MTLLLYRTPKGPVITVQGKAYSIVAESWDALVNSNNLASYLSEHAAAPNEIPFPSVILAPMVGQELWGAGVTYYTSRMARMAESQSADAGDCYSRVFEAERPELFFKANAGRVVDPGGSMRLRRDASWIVPEPEMALVINSEGEIIGYTIANDLTCRDIEGENPLYLPQAKIWDRCAAVGPGLLIQDSPMPATTRIELEIRRGSAVISASETTLSMLKREPRDLVAYLTREASFPNGCILMTGTGIVPDENISLQPGDEVRISVEPIGTLTNTMD
jgi:2-dehydro-3-deoxy-D-arabinonate dehydratase